MDRIKHAANGSKRSMALVSLGLILLLAQAVGHTQVPDALPFSRGYLITGGYAVGGVDLSPGSGGGGSLTGTINMSGVPANAEILGAFVYWEAITADLSQAAGARFRGSLLTNVKTSSMPLTPATAQCWSSGGGGGAVYTMSMFTADVLHLLPIQLDVNGNPAGRRLVNDEDLAKYGYGPHTVTLPEAGTGNQVPQAAGASLFVIYRDATKPLTSISVYEGIYVQEPGATMKQTVRGFLQSSTSQNARMTQIGGSGAKNPTDRVWFDNGRTPKTLLATDAFVGSNNAASDRAWANPTFVVSSNSTPASLMPGTDFYDGYGETVTTTVDHERTNSYDCLSWAAIIFSASVPDVDHDGNPDIVENNSTDVAGHHWTDPSGRQLPDLHAMGASSTHKDLFVELGWMTTGGYTGGQGEVPAHNHRPTPAAIKMTGDAFWCAGTVPCDASTASPTNRIEAHFDAGNDFPVYSGADAYAERYIIRNTTPGLARGGEHFTETACVVDTQSPPRWNCQFPDYPGTVTWKRGFLAHRAAFVHDDGTALNHDDPADAAFLENCQMPGVNCRKRFDRERNNFFHYILFAHSRGIPKSTDPASPDFHVPSSSGGRGDLPFGGDAVVTLGWWDNFVGTDLNQASTMAHELGHNLGLWHGGPPMQLTEVGTSPNTRVNVYIEPNCKSNYLSLMNYAFGFTGLLDDDGIPHVDFSGGKIDDIDETILRDGALAGTTSLYTPQYRTAWFVPTLSTNPAKAKRFCGDKHFPDPLPLGWTDMVRVDAQTVAESIDWNKNGSTVDSNFSQDVNFSGDLSGLFAVPPTPTFHGYNDWASVRLDQVGSRGNQAGFSSAGGDLDFVGGDLDFVGGDLDFVGGDLDFVGGDLDFVGGDLDFVGGDLDFVGGDVEPTFAAAAAMGYASPNTFKACVIGTGGVDCLTPAPPLPPALLKHRTRSAWKVPVVGSDKVTLYTGYRALGSAFNPATAVQVGTPSSSTNQVDNEELPDGVLNNIKFTYSVTATFVDGTVSAYSASKSATITPVNDPPVAVADSYTMLWKGTLNVTGSGVLANDTDADSPATSLRAVLNAGPSHGTLTLRADGSFTYKPDKTFFGTDTFSYRANDGVWSRDSTKVMSANSNLVIVTIVVNKN